MGDRRQGIRTAGEGELRAGQQERES